MTELATAIMERDGLTAAEAAELIADAQERIYNGDDPEEVLFEDFGLEPDYVFDLIG